MFFTRVIFCVALLGTMADFMAEGAPPLKRSPNFEGGSVEGQFPGIFPDDDYSTDDDYYHQFDQAPIADPAEQNFFMVEVEPEMDLSNSPASKKHPNETFIPECAKKTGSSFCEEVDKYPREYFKKALAGTRFEWLLKRNLNLKPDLVPRDGGFPQLCTSEQMVIFPRSGYNENEELRFLFNDGRNQAVEIEVCRNVVHHCENLDAKKLGFESTRCSQKYRLMEMVALSPEGEPYEESFKFPSGCVCSFSTPQRVNFDPYRKFGSKLAMAASRKTHK